MELSNLGAKSWFQRAYVVNSGIPVPGWDECLGRAHCRRLDNDGV